MTRAAFTLGLAVAVALGLTWLAVAVALGLTWLAVAVALGLTWLAVLVVAGWRVALRWHPQGATP